MIKLKKVTIHKYKSYETQQSFGIDDKITVLVGKNESGKTAALETIAKTNHFQNDSAFEFNSIFDYPRREKKKYDKSGNDDVVITTEFLIEADLLNEIESDIGKNVLKNNSFIQDVYYSNQTKTSGIETNLQAFLLNIRGNFDITDSNEKEIIVTIKNIEELNKLIQEEEIRFQQKKDEETQKAKTENRSPNTIDKSQYYECLETLKKYFKNNDNWENPLAEYIYREWIEAQLPKYLYYDDYYNLPSRIDISTLASGSQNDPELKTSKALFELADIKTEEIISNNNFEAFISELEATGNEITQTLFKFWKTNTDLRIKFQLDKQTNPNGIKNILDIRVENLKHMVTIPLKNRSKGFNWFFSFIVWFSKIQEDKNSNYVILLDEPGLNLHASAQADLLKFIEFLSESYQIIYTTHSPFMVEPDKLHRVRTVLEKENGTHISESTQEKDPDTLFPLQAALGYDLAQNLFISKKNLLVEGVADLIYLNIFSSLLQSEGRIGLLEDITIVPVGGLDKVATFISLLRSSKLDLVCLLDTPTNSKQRLDDLIKSKIIKENNIRFFHEFCTNDKADIEDMFERSEYIKFFNEAFTEYNDIKITDLDSKSSRIIPQINKILGIERYNHFRPANKLAQLAVSKDYFSGSTIDRFEKMFIEINKLLH